MAILSILKLTLLTRLPKIALVIFELIYKRAGLQMKLPVRQKHRLRDVLSYWCKPGGVKGVGEAGFSVLRSQV